jgi:hypothetical protein
MDAPDLLPFYQHNKLNLLDTNTEFLIKSKESSDGELTIQAHSRPPSDYFMNVMNFGYILLQHCLR